MYKMIKDETDRETSFPLPTYKCTEEKCDGRKSLIIGPSVLELRDCIQ
jgi:hypothetical protein